MDFLGGPLLNMIRSRMLMSLEAGKPPFPTCEFAQQDVSTGEHPPATAGGTDFSNEAEARRMFSGELRVSASSIRLPREDQSDRTNAIRSFRCAAVSALKLFLAAVA